MDILTLQQTLETQASTIQLDPRLPGGTYQVDLLVRDGLGATASASLLLRIGGTVLPTRPPITPVQPPIVVDPVGPVVRPPLAPITPVIRPAVIVNRPAVKTTASRPAAAKKTAGTRNKARKKPSPG